MNVNFPKCVRFYFNRLNNVKCWSEINVNIEKLNKLLGLCVSIRVSHLELCCDVSVVLRLTNTCSVAALVLTAPE